MPVNYAKHRPKNARRPLDQVFAKELTKQKIRLRQEAWRQEVKQLQEKADIRKAAELLEWRKKMLPFIEITHTDEFKEFYKNRTDSDWNEQIENSPSLFEMYLLNAEPWLTDQEFYGQKAYKKSLKFNGLGLLEGWQRRWKRQLQATPLWIDRTAIKEFYLARDIMNFLYPEEAPWHVDHVIPLAGEYVCGLHHHDNMQLLPGSVNLRKHNGFDI